MSEGNGAEPRNDGDGCRQNGADGDVTIKWRTIDKTAIGGKDYTGGEGEIEFKHGETRRDIKIPIIDDMEAEPDDEERHILMYRVLIRNCEVHKTY